MNTRQKGTRTRTKCKELLKTMGWLIDVVEKTGKFNKETDMFGLFDLHSINEDGFVNYIQVTCNRNHPHKKYQAFADKYGKPNIMVQQYVWIDRGGWVLFDYKPYKKYSKEIMYETEKT